MEKNKDAILIVEDNKDMQLLLTTILSDEGFLIHQAYEGKTALKLYRELMPQLVLLDLRLPGMNGLEIFSKMKNIKKDVLAFLITAYGDKKTKKEAMQLGATAYFTKPFDNLELVEKIKSVLSQQN